jgi:hypothetical protein
LSLPTSSHAYGQKPHQISEYSYTMVKRVLEALERLDWIERKKGFKNRDGEHVPTRLKAIGGLLNVFEKQPYVWRQIEPNKRDVIILKGYDSETRQKDVTSFVDNNFVRKSRKNLQQINAFIAHQAICLAMDNWSIDQVIKKMSNQDYRVDWDYSSLNQKPRNLNFLHTQMRRIFARNSFALGGRFYGAWWQHIPSDCRPFITINDKDTNEIDYSELHPRLMYWEAGLPLPEGDLYDLGLRYPDHPTYDQHQEPYKSKRKVIKTYINALLNDEKGNFCLNREQIRILDMNTAQLYELVINKHPLIVENIGKGLHYQFLDSQLAEKVMLKLLAQDIVCLPIHDSFIVQTEHVPSLHTAMSEAYAELFQGLPAIKNPELSKTQFEVVTYPSGEIDQTYMSNHRLSSIHEIFISSWKKSEKIS